MSTRLLVALVAILASLVLVPGHASAAIPANFFTVADGQGVNDVNSDQVDLTQFGRDDSSPTAYKVFWSWDSTDQWTGSGQTGDACALFDSDGDTNINFAVCGQITNSGGTATVVQTAGSPFAFTCNNSKPDRCAGPMPVVAAPGDIQAGALDAGTPLLSPPNNLITATDPFPAGSNAPNDATLELIVQKAFLPAGATLVNVCSYPSAGNGGNNNPFDCIVTPGGGFLVVHKVAPNGTTQTFSFTVDPGAVPVSIVGSGDSDPVSLPVGSAAAVTETVPTGWQLDSASCTLSDHLTPTGTKTGSKVSGITIQSGQVTDCTFTNSLSVVQPALTVVKDNDANHDATFSDTETVPGAAAYPYTVTYRAMISNAAGSSAATITAIGDDKTAAPLRSASATDLDCADVIGTSIASGATVTCYYDQTFANANTAQVVNTVSVTASNTAGSDTETDTSTVNFTQVKSIDLVKTATPKLSTTPTAGDKITYGFTITNTGNTTLTGVDLDDALIGYSNHSCGTATLAPGAFTTCSADYTITQADIDAGTVHNSATACGTPPAGADACDTDTTDTPITAVPVITLLKADTSNLGAVPQPGETITYAFKITNDGNTTLSSVDLTDALLGLTNVSCGGTTILAPGAFTTCSADYPITQADIDAGTVHNSATSCGSPPIGTNVCDDASTDTPVARVPGLMLEKTATAKFSATPTAGDTITYAFKVTNTGNTTLTGENLDDSLIGYSNHSCGTATLAPGAFTTCSADYTITQADIDAGTRHNSATDCAATPGTATPVCDTDTTDTPITRSPGLSLVKTATPNFGTPPKAGDKVAYGFTITNTGNTTLTAVNLDDALLGYTDVDCEKTTLAPGGTATCSADYAITQTDVDAGTVHNSATACGTPPAGADACDTDTTDTDITPSKAIDLVKTATPHFSGPPAAGDKITYSFVITNTGNVTLTGVKLNDALAGLSNATCGAVTSLAPGASTSCTKDYAITQADIDAGTVTNSATSCGTPPGGPTGSVCDTDGTTTTITRVRSLQLTKVASPTVYTQTGDVITYTYTLKNTGNVTLKAPFTVADDKTTPSSFSCSNATTLAPGASTTCTADYTITAADVTPAITGSVTNHATATAKDPGDQTVTSNQAQATATQVQPTARITPTGTTCADYAANTAANLEDLAYTVLRNKVNSVAPGVLFYYSTIKAPSSSFTITVPQTNTAGWKAMPVQTTGQVLLYGADCTKSGAQKSAAYAKNTGTATITVGGATTGATYYIGIKYSPTDLTGQSVSSPFPFVTYKWSTLINNTLIVTSTDKAKLSPK